MISVVIFSAVVLVLVGLAFQVARRNVRSTHQSLVMAALGDAVDRATVLDYDSLSTIAGCDTTFSGSIAVSTCATLTTIAPAVTEVRLIVTTSVPGGSPDTITLRRGRVRNPLPLR